MAVGVSELIVHPPRIAFKTVFCSLSLTMYRDRDTDVSGACETYRVFWGLEERKTRSCGQQETRCSGRAPVFSPSHTHDVFHTMKFNCKLWCSKAQKLTKMHYKSTVNDYICYIVHNIWPDLLNRAHYCESAIP